MPRIARRPRARGPGRSARRPAASLRLDTLELFGPLAGSSPSTACKTSSNARHKAGRVTRLQTQGHECIEDVAQPRQVHQL